MKREELLRQLRRHGCMMLREGARHSWWYNPGRNRRSAIPRYREIHDLLARKICRDLGVPPIKGA
jgi:mRNA interferase HicA